MGYWVLGVGVECQGIGGGWWVVGGEDPLSWCEVWMEIICVYGNDRLAYWCDLIVEQMF